MAKGKKYAELPKGYAPISAGYAPTWDPAARPLLEGVVSDFRDIKVTRGTGRNKREEQQNLCTLTTDAGEAFTVWESALLRGMFEQAKDGDRVALAFRGMGKAKKGQNAPKLIDVGIIPGKGKGAARSKKRK